MQTSNSNTQFPRHVIPDEISESMSSSAPQNEIENLTDIQDPVKVCQLDQLDQ